MSVCSVAIIVAAIIITGVNPLPAIPASAPIPVRRVVVIGVAPVPAAAYEPRKESKAVTVTGGPKWDAVPYEVGPEAGLLRLRKDMNLFANLRPAICYPALADASSLKRELVDGLDLMVVRELTGGVYFGEPKQIIDLGNGQKRAIDTQDYHTYEIETDRAGCFRARGTARPLAATAAPSAAKASNTPKRFISFSFQKANLAGGA